MARLTDQEKRTAVEILIRAEPQERVYICIQIAESMHRQFNAGISRMFGVDGNNNPIAAVIVGDVEAIQRIIVLLDQIEAERNSDA